VEAFTEYYKDVFRDEEGSDGEEGDEARPIVIE
jgi:hypothetical protein